MYRTVFLGRNVGGASTNMYTFRGHFIESLGRGRRNIGYLIAAMCILVFACVVGTNTFGGNAIGGPVMATGHAE